MLKSHGWPCYGDTQPHLVSSYSLSLLVTSEAEWPDWKWFARWSLSDRSNTLSRTWVLGNVSSVASKKKKNLLALRPQNKDVLIPTIRRWFSVDPWIPPISGNMEIFHITKRGTECLLFWIIILGKSVQQTASEDTDRGSGANGKQVNRPLKESGLSKLRVPFL